MRSRSPRSPGDLHLAREIQVHSDSGHSSTFEAGMRPAHGLFSRVLEQKLQAKLDFPRASVPTNGLFVSGVEVAVPKVLGALSVAVGAAKNVEFVTL